jgi:hypothetical protein
MRPIQVISVALALRFAAGEAGASPLVYDCDTEEGSYSQLSQVQAGPAYHVRGTITPLQVRSHDRFLPMAQIRIDNSDRSGGIAVQLASMHRDDHFDIVVAKGAGRNSELQRTPAGTSRMNETVPFELSVSPDGNAIAIVGQQRVSLHVNIGRGGSVLAICSTGEFEFGELELGN